MFNNLVTYTIHHQAPLPPMSAMGYEYLMAQNGLFVRGETAVFQATIPITHTLVRGLQPITPSVKLKIPQLPGQFLHHILNHARQARNGDGELIEVLYQIRLTNGQFQVEIPPQQGSKSRVQAPGDEPTNIVLDIHSHGAAPAYFSSIDDDDEQGARFYAVLGKLDSDRPQLALRVGLYGYYWSIPPTLLFEPVGLPTLEIVQN